MRIVFHVVQETAANLMSTRVILHPESTRWVARGIDFELTAQGDTKERAMENFAYAVYLHVGVNVQSQRPMLEDIQRRPHVYPIVQPGERDILALANIQAPI